MFIARITLQIRDHESFRRHAAGELDTAAVRALPGCVTYRFCQDVARPNEVLLYEEWATRADFEAYKASSLFTRVGAGLRPLLAAPPSSAYYESEDLFTACAGP